MPSNDTDISVVIIARNEEEMIADCIESVIDALEYAKERGIINTYEIILSDSSSTDKTIGIAKKYPIRIVQLKPDWKLSAPAGRYIGSLYAKGEFVFFTDGDCKVYKEWFVQAMPYMKQDEIAGIDGYEREYISENNFFYETLDEEISKSENPNIEDRDFIGKGIFKRNILEKAGSYNPWLKGSEERDLSFRIRRLGYKLNRHPFPANLHHWAKKSGNLTYWTMVKTMVGWSYGDGQMLKYHLNDPVVVKDTRTRYFRWGMMTNHFPTLLLLQLTLINLLGFMTFFNSYTIIALLLDIILLLIIGYWRIREQKTLSHVIYKHFQLIPYTFLRQAFLFVGLTTKKQNIEDYPKDAEIIQ